MTHTDHKAELLTAASALALYDAAKTAADVARAAAAMAHVLRTTPEPVAKAPRRVKAADGDNGTLNAQNLAAALKRAAAIVEKRNSIPILSNVLLEMKAGTLTITTTDLDNEYTEKLTDAPEIADFSCTVSVHNLVGLIGKARGGIGLVLEPDYKLKVSASGAEAVLPILPAEDFPRMAFNGKMSLRIGADELREAFAFVAPAISTEETRYYLNTVWFHPSNFGDEGADKVWTSVATDGHRLMLCKSTVVAEPDFPGLLIQRKTVGWMTKHLPAGETVTVKVESVSDGKEQHVNRFRIITKRGALTAKTMDGTFPDFWRVVPRLEGFVEGAAALVTIPNAKAVSGCVTQLASISQEKSRAMKMIIGPGDVVASVKNMESGVVEAPLPGVTMEGKAHVIGLNARYFLDVLAKGDDLVMRVSDPASPIRVDWPAQPGRLAVLMPLRP